MQIEQPAWPLVREHEHLSTARKNDYHGGSCIVISAPARQFHVDHDDALKDIGPNERLCFVLAQTPDISKFVFEQVEGRILLNSLLPNTLGMNAINGKVFFELAFHAESRGVILYNRSQYSQKIHPFSSTPYVLAKEKFSVLPPGTYELLTRNFQIRMKVLNADECNTLNEAVQAGDKRKRYIDGDDRASSPQARADGPSKYRKDGSGAAMDVALFDFRPVESNSSSQARATMPTHSQFVVQLDQSLERLKIPGVGKAPGYTIKKIKDILRTTAAQLYLAEHSAHPEPLVVKVSAMLSTRFNEEGERAFNASNLWFREFLVHRNLQHRSIAKLLGHDSRLLSLYIEYIPGQDLRHCCHKLGPLKSMTTLSSEDALRVWQDMASAVAYLHSQGFHHNDIKPHNIIWSVERGAVLCDFGLSSTAADACGGGTPYYVPPEWTRLSERGPTSDVWALGITMLYVYGFISLPDHYATFELDGLPKTYWHIATVRNAYMRNIVGNSRALANLPKEKQDAIAAAQRWLEFVAGIANGLDDQNPLFALLQRTVDEEPVNRPSVRELDLFFSRLETLNLGNPSSPSQDPALDLDARSLPVHTSNVQDLFTQTPPVQTPAVHGPGVHRSESRSPAVRSSPFGGGDTQLISSDTFAALLTRPSPMSDWNTQPLSPHTYSPMAGGNTQPTSADTYAANLNPPVPRGDTQSLPSQYYAGYKRDSQRSSNKGKERQTRSGE